MWQALQASFAQALLSKEMSAPMRWDNALGEGTSKRFDIHRNNFLTGLADSLAVRFPVTRRIVGDDFFAAMAREFVLRHPPRSPVLLDYGDEFAEFGERFAPAAALPYLSDVVRLENARVRAYHAADVATLRLGDLAELDLTRSMDLKFHVHPATAVLRSDYPILTLWAMNAGELELTPIEDWRGEAALIYRRDHQVKMEKLTPACALFLRRLVDGGALGDAALFAMGETTDFDLTEPLATLLSAGVITAVLYKGDGEP